MRVDRTHVNNSATFARLDHRAHTGTCRQKRAVQMNGRQFFPIVETQIHDWANDLDAGITDEHIDRSIGRHNVGDALVDLRFVSNVHRDTHRNTTSPDDLIGSR